MSWKYTNSSNMVVARTNADGSVESKSVEAIADWIAEGNTPEPAFTPSELIAAITAKIKAERDRRWYDGGVLVAGNWFLSTLSARTDYLTMVQLYGTAPDATVIRAGWRTMNGIEVTMTVGLVKAIMAAGLASVAATDNASQAHIVAMTAAENPTAYDFLASWPLIFGES